MLRLGICGACGKMGRRIAALAAKDPDVKIIAALESEEVGCCLGQDLGAVINLDKLDVEVSSDLNKACDDVDCVIDFTLPGPTIEHVEACQRSGTPLVIGTTGLDPDQEEKIKAASRNIPIVFSPNMAVGVNLLFDVVKEVSRVLKNDFNIKIDETHHVHKKDSPSGTAKMIAKVIEKASGTDAPIEAFREGEVIGNHGIIFDGEFETIEIRHNAKTRDVFAAGAIKAAKFLIGKTPGLYTMGDVLGLK